MMKSRKFLAVCLSAILAIAWYLRCVSPPFSQSVGLGVVPVASVASAYCMIFLLRLRRCKTLTRVALAVAFATLLQWLPLAGPDPQDPQPGVGLGFFLLLIYLPSLFITALAIVLIDFLGSKDRNR